jgi:Icc protein
MRSFVLLILLTLSFPKAFAQTEDFSFLFMTDMHLRPDSVVEKAFDKVVTSVKNIKPDFVLSGGDQIFDIMRGNQAKGDALFSYYVKQTQRLGVPVYNCVGNHDLFGIYEESPEDSTHSDYKLGMFKRYLGEPYYSFNHKGWHFIVLNVLDVENYKYVGKVDDKQLAWLAENLKSVPENTPIVVTVHIPLLTAFHVMNDGTYPTQPPVSNRAAVLDKFKNHNLKFVLQGHLHWFEDLNIAGKTRFITGGAVSGRPTWRGNIHGDRGFLKFNVKGGEASYEFVAYEK